MISNAAINQRLRKFVCTRFGLGEKNRYAKGKYKMPGTGGFALLDPDGNYAEGMNAPSNGGNFMSFRWTKNSAETVKKLDELLAKYPGKPGKADFHKIYWLDGKTNHGSDYNANPYFVAWNDRKAICLLVADDPLPEKVEKTFADQRFLTRNYRSFLYARVQPGSKAKYPAAVLPLIQSTKGPFLVFLAPNSEGPLPVLGKPFSLTGNWDADKLEKAMNEAWRAYMKVRKDTGDHYKMFTAGGPNGGGFGMITPFHHKEHDQFQKLLQEGKLLPPGQGEGK